MVRRNKIISILLIPLIIMSVLVHGPTAQAHEQEMESGLELSKKAEFEESTRVINYELEAYQKGEIKEISTSEPLDVVLVLDQSGSMTSNSMNDLAYVRVTDNDTKLKEISTQKELYYLNEQSKFVSVEVSCNAELCKIRDSLTKLEIVKGNQNTTLNFHLYEKKFKPTRLDALRTSVDIFLNQISIDAKKHNVNHRIAMVGFAGDSDRNYKGTEILGTIDSIKTINYTDTVRWNDKQFEKSLVPINDNQVFSISNNISSYRGTRTFLGMDLARKIINSSQSDERKSIVILFTDGSANGDPRDEYEEGLYNPPWNYREIEKKSYNESIKHAELIKAKEALIYSVGVVDGASPTAVDNKGNIDGKINRFLHYISSNFNEIDLRRDDNRQLPEDISYYLSAESSEELNNAFQTISKEIFDKPSLNLDEETVLKDDFPDYISVDDIKLSDLEIVTQVYVGEDKWGEEEIYSNALVELDKNERSLKISNYNYTDNIVGHKNDSFFGRKIIVRFSAPLSHGFIGGNQVITNKDSSGIYFNDKKIEEFPVPTVDIPLEFSIDSGDHSIYLSNDFDLDDLIYKDNSFKYKIDDSEFQLDGINNSYVDIKLSIMHNEEIIWEQIVPAGDVFECEQIKGNLDKFSDTTDFTINYEVTSINNRDISQSNQLDSKVYVYKPEVMSSDTESYLGDYMVFSDSFTLDKTKWSVENYVEKAPQPHEKYRKPILDINVLEIPDFDIQEKYYWQFDRTFSYEVLLDSDNSFNDHIMPEDKVVKHNIIPVSLILDILEKNVDKFRADDNFKFKIKWLGTDGSYPFDNIYDMDVFLKGNEQIEISGLPIGKYEVVEDTKWSWRYESVGEVSQVKEILNDKTEYKFSFDNNLINKKHLGKEVIINNRYE